MSVRPSVCPQILSGLYFLQYWSDLFYFLYGNSPLVEGVSHVTFVTAPH